MECKIVVKTKQKAIKRNEVLKLIAQQAYEQKIILKKDINRLYKAFVNREQLSTTALFQNSIAIPHAQIEEIKQTAIIVMQFSCFVCWPSINENEEEGVKCVIALLVPKNKVATNYIDLLANISRLLLEDEFKKTLLTNKNANEIKKYLLTKMHHANDNQNLLNNNVENQTSPLYKIVGVSACATGVAHTYMAKDALENAAKALNYIVKIETQGRKKVLNIN